MQAVNSGDETGHVTDTGNILDDDPRPIRSLLYTKRRTH